MTNHLQTCNKPRIFVSAGILFNKEGEFLLASRPAGKVYAGYWEFPGGKIEAGETALAALIRELEEEMGIHITQAYPWLQQTFDYPHAHVTLFFFHVTAWQGNIIAKEKQQFCWQQIDHLTAHPILPANDPIIRALALPRFLMISRSIVTEEATFLTRLEQQFAQGKTWLILDIPHQEKQCLLFAEKVLTLAHRYSSKVILHTHHGLAQQLGADGLHMSAKTLMNWESRPIDLPYCGAFIDSFDALTKVSHLQLDYAVLGNSYITSSASHCSQLNWQDFADTLQHRNTIPVYAFGGLHTQDLHTARMCGAHGILLENV